MKRFKDYVDEIISYMVTEKNLTLDPTPKIELDKTEHSAFDPFVPTGHYDFSSNTVTLYVSNRQCKDILRTLCHELIHVSQYRMDPEGYAEFNKSGSIAENKALRKYEREAYTLGNLYFRDWTESKRMRQTAVT